MDCSRLRRKCVELIVSHDVDSLGHDGGKNERRMRRTELLRHYYITAARMRSTTVDVCL